MGMIALAVLLAVMQAGAPSPRKTTDDPAQTGAQVKGKSASSQAKSPPAPASVKIDTSGPTKTESSEQHPQDTQRTVGISKLPPVTVNPAKRDWADWAYWGFNFLLAVTSGFQVYLLLRTLYAVNRQAEETGRQVEVTAGQLRAMNEQITEMSVQSGILQNSVSVARDAANAAKDSATAALNSERPWLVVTPTSPSNNQAHYVFEASNYGRTPAEVTYSHAVSVIVADPLLDIPILPPDGGWVFAHKYFLLPVEQLSQIANPLLQNQTVRAYSVHTLDAHTALNTQAVRQEISIGTKWLMVYGIVVYADVLTKASHYTRFCYMWSPRGGMPLGGPPGANEHT